VISTGLSNGAEHSEHEVAQARIHPEQTGAKSMPALHPQNTHLSAMAFMINSTANRIDVAAEPTNRMKVVTTPNPVIQIVAVSVDAPSPWNAIRCFSPSGRTATSA
jgi:hypothetical protein